MPGSPGGEMRARCHAGALRGRARRRYHAPPWSNCRRLPHNARVLMRTLQIKVKPGSREEDLDRASRRKLAGACQGAAGRWQGECGADRAGGGAFRPAQGTGEHPQRRRWPHETGAAGGLDRNDHAVHLRPAFGLPDPSPFVMKAEMLLKLAGLPYETSARLHAQGAQGQTTLHPRRRDRGRGLHADPPVPRAEVRHRLRSRAVGRATAASAGRWRRCSRITCTGSWCTGAG